MLPMLQCVGGTWLAPVSQGEENLLVLRQACVVFWGERPALRH